jgi:hypothetical protein
VSGPRIKYRVDGNRGPWVTFVTGKRRVQGGEPAVCSTAKMLAHVMTEFLKEHS